LIAVFARPLDLLRAVFGLLGDKIVDVDGIEV
jgi:hypothetical protein